MATSAEQRAKRARGKAETAPTPITMDALKLLLTEQFNNFHESMSNKLITLSNDVNASMAGLSGQIQESSNTCKDRHDSTTDRVDDLSSKLSSLQHQLDDEQERINRLSEVIVRGIPVLNNETGNTLMELFKAISSAINFNALKFPAVKVIRLMQRRQTSIPPPILIKFGTAEAKS